MGYFLPPDLLAGITKIAPRPAAGIGSRRVQPRTGFGGGGLPPGDFAPDNRLGSIDDFLRTSAPQATSFDGPVDFGRAPISIAPSLTASPTITPNKPGFFDRIGDFIGSDEGKAALLRAGAEMLRSGSVGGGVMAGADFMDKRKAIAAEAQRDALDRAIRQQQVNQSGAYQQGSLDLQRDELGEKRYQYDNPSGSDKLRERSALDRTIIGERGANYRTGVQASTTQRGQTLDYNLGRARLQEDRRQYDTPSANATLAAETSRYTHDNPSGDARLQAAGIGSKAMGTRTVEYQEEVPGTDGWFSSPEMRTVKEESPLVPPSQVQPTANQEVRYDAQGQAYVQGPNGTAVRAPQFDRQ